MAYYLTSSVYDQKMYALSEQLSEEKALHTVKILEIERENQNKVDELEQKAVQIERDSRDEIARLNELIDSFRLRDNDESKSAAEAVPAAPVITCSTERRNADKWRAAFVRLSELAGRLAAERDEIARIKNELVATYEELRKQSLDYAQAPQR